MDKKYLGLGVGMGWTDQGLAKGVKDMVTGLTKVDKSIKDVEQSADGKGGKGPFQNMMEGLKTFSISHIAGMMEDVKSAALGEGGGIDETFKTLDMLRAKLGQTFDPKIGEQFRVQMMGVMRATGLTADQTDTLAMTMANYGRSSKEIMQSLPMMGKMVGVLGVDAGKVAEMFGHGLANLSATPKQMELLIKDTVKMQKAYNLTDLYSTLPEIIAAVNANAVRFGKIQPEAAIKTVKSVAQLVSVFQKVGKSQTEATQAALGFTNKISDMRRSITDMQAGLDPLDDSIDEMIGVMGMMGISGEKAFDMIMTQDPAELMKSLSDEMAGLDEQSQKMVGAHLRRVVGDDMANLMTSYRDDVSGAIDAAGEQEKKLGTASDEFGKLETAMTGTIGVQKNLTEAAKSYFDLTVKFANKGDYINALAAQRDAWNSMTEKISSADSALGWFVKKMDLLKEYGLTGLFPGMAAFGVMGEILIGVIWPLGKVAGLVQTLWGTLGAGKDILGGLKAGLGKVLNPISTMAGWVGKLTDKMGWFGKGLQDLVKGGKIGAVSKAFGKFGSIVTKLVGPIVAVADGIMMLWRDWSGFMDSISKAEGFGETFGVIIKQLLKWAGELIYDVVLAIPDWITKALTGYDFKSLLKFYTEFFDEMFGGLITKLTPNWLSSMIKGVGGDKAKGAEAVPGTKTQAAAGAVGAGSDALAKGAEKVFKNASSPLVLAPPAKPGAAAGAGSSPQLIPTKVQEGAPIKATAPSVEPSSIQLKDKNFQAVVDSIVSMKDELASILSQLAERPVNVQLLGDAKKFIKAADRAGMEGYAGSSALAGSVGR